MSTEAQKIRQLNQKLFEAHAHNSKLSEQLEETISRNRINERHLNDLKSGMKVLSEEANKLREDLRKKQVLTKSYQNNLHNKNIQINKVQESLETQAKASALQSNNRVQELSTIVRLQEEEINQLLDDLRKMVGAFRQVDLLSQQQAEQKQILYKFNKELQNQVQGLENQQQQALKQLEETRGQLQLQNQQSQDLLCQIGAMTHQLQSKVEA